MLSLSMLHCFFIPLLFIVLFLLYGTNAKNNTFNPVPISITVASLPAPYNTSSYPKYPVVLPVPDNPELFVPYAFSVKTYMTGLISPSYLLYTPTGDLLVSEPDANRVSCLLDTDGDGYPDERLTFADAFNGLSRPSGMAFANGYFYVGSQNETRRYEWFAGSRGIYGRGESVMTYSERGHWTRTIVVSPEEDRIYIGIGSGTNVDVEPSPRASVQVTMVSRTDFSTFAYGLRNPVGLAFHPVTNDLYVTCQERDGLGGDLVPDYFTRIKQDDFYGWPYAYMSPNLTDPRRRLANATSERPDLVAITRTPDILFEAQSAVADTLFYTGKQFPPKYHNGAFAALHGSWNRDNGAGYKIVFVPFDSTTNRPMGYYEDFVTGFLVKPPGPDTFGRPVGLLVLNDGSLIFTEDGNNVIYQVQYNSSAPTTTTTTTTTTTVTTTSTTSSTSTTTTTAIVTTTTAKSNCVVVTELLLIFGLFMSLLCHL